jgi:hypothetical protein
MGCNPLLLEKLLNLMAVNDQVRVVHHDETIRVNHESG